jgi:hypothetical protein
MANLPSSDPTSVASRDWVPRWTVITTPPGVAERWAMRAMSQGRQGGVTILALCVVYTVFAAVGHWRDGETSWLVSDVVLIALISTSAWHRYAFGLLLERYDAELRDIHTKQ